MVHAQGHGQGIFGPCCAFASCQILSPNRHVSSSPCVAELYASQSSKTFPTDLLKDKSIKRCCSFTHSCHSFTYSSTRDTEQQHNGLSTESNMNSCRDRQSHLGEFHTFSSTPAKSHNYLILISIISGTE